MRGDRDRLLDMSEMCELLLTHASGVRVVLAHAYHHVDQDIIGAVVARDIPALQRDLAAIIGDLPAGD